MWIIPRNSRFSAFVPATAASNSDFPGHWQTLCESLLWRSKGSPWRTWKQRLLRAPWLSTLCGRILKPSRQSDFEDALISSLAATRASRSVTPASGKARTTLDTFGRILQRSCEQFSLFGASSRTLPDTCPLDSPPFIEAYESWVTQLRRDCLQRPSAARPTNGSGCSSWPTMNVPNRGCELDKSHRPESGGVDLQSAVQMYPTPAAANYRDGKASPATMARNSRPLQEVAISGQPHPASPSTNGKNQGLWASMQTTDAIKGGNVSPRPGAMGLSEQTGRKLNPLWVSQLMGVPVGWCDPEWINCDCWATESCPPRPSAPSAACTQYSILNTQYPIPNFEERSDPMREPLTDNQIWGHDDPHVACVTCDFFAPPERGNVGHCVRLDPGKRGKYPEVTGGQRACNHHQDLEPGAINTQYPIPNTQ